MWVLILKALSNLNCNFLLICNELFTYYVLCLDQRDKKCWSHQRAFLFHHRQLGTLFLFLLKVTPGERIPAILRYIEYGLISLGMTLSSIPSGKRNTTVVHSLSIQFIRLHHLNGLNTTFHNFLLLFITVFIVIKNHKSYSPSTQITTSNSIMITINIITSLVSIIIIIIISTGQASLCGSGPTATWWPS